MHAPGRRQQRKQHEKWLLRTRQPAGRRGNKYNKTKASWDGSPKVLRQLRPPTAARNKRRHPPQPSPLRQTQYPPLASRWRRRFSAVARQASGWRSRRQMAQASVSRGSRRTALPMANCKRHLILSPPSSSCLICHVAASSARVCAHTQL